MVESFSILIPIYNFNVVPLVEQLEKLALKTTKPFEILLIDDFSDQSFRIQNQKVQQKENVKYIELTENVGRSKIRNLLFDKAKHEFCIILDCDVLLAKEDFLIQYLENLKEDNIVVGGHVYLPKPPKDKSKYFHWLYGRNLEVKPLSERLKKPYDSFMTNSFALSKSLFNKLKFDEEIAEYGHEDTIFGINLAQLNIPIVHINNPVVHLGLETETVFFEKQTKAISNLVKLLQNDSYRDILTEKVKLVAFYTLFYNKKPYKYFIYIIMKIVFFLESFIKFDFLRLTKFNLWKLKTFDTLLKSK